MLRLARGVRVQFERVTQTHVVLFPEGVVQLNPAAHSIISRLPVRIDDLRMILKREFDGSSSTDVPADLRALDAFLNDALDARWMCLEVESIN